MLHSACQNLPQYESTIWRNQDNEDKRQKTRESFAKEEKKNMFVDNLDTVLQEPVF
jgi:hypothetical protein